jgi:hypothetical protein
VSARTDAGPSDPRAHQTSGGSFIAKKQKNSDMKGWFKMYHDRKTKSVVQLLERASHFNRLAKACPPHCSAGFYRMKDNALQRALNMAPEQFFIDTPQHDVKNKIIGVTHIQSQRRFHIQADKWKRSINS